MNRQIYHSLHNRIVFLEYAPGQILKEQVLAEEFGVSRTPLRTVLFRLEWEHLVKILPRTGIQVSEIELNTITHLFQARLELESVIGTMAAERFLPPYFTRLDACGKQCGQLLERRDSRALGQLDMDLKQIFHDAAGNPFLTEMSDRFYVLTFRLWYFNLIKMDNQAWRQEVLGLQSDIKDLMDMLGTGSPEQVGKTRKIQLLAHVERIRATFLGLSGT